MMPREERFDAWKSRPGRGTLVPLLEANQGRILAICHDVLHDRHEAEEAAQEALFKIVSGLDRVADAEHFDRWSVQVAMRTALDRRRASNRRRRRELQAAFHSPGESTPCGDLRDAIGQLPEEDRALILERYFDSRTFDEMGKSRGLSDVAVRKQVVKARERLKRMLGGLAFWTVMKTKSAAAAALILAVLIAGWITFHRGSSSIAATSRRPAPVDATAHVAPDAPVKTPPVSEASPEGETSPAKLSWKTAAPQYAYMSSPLIPVPGKYRVPFDTAAMIFRDQSVSWGLDPEVYKRIRPVISAVRRIDEEILKSWGGEVKQDGPHEQGKVADKEGLAAFLIAVSDGKRSDVSQAVENGVEEKYAFDDPGTAVKYRALAMLGSFPGDPAVIDHLRRLMGSTESSEIRGLAASNLVKLGHEAAALPVLRGSDSASRRVLLAALSLGTSEGESDPDHAAGGYPIQGSESRDPQFLEGLVGILNARPDRESYLLAAKALSLASNEPAARNALLSCWNESRKDHELAEKLMENKYQWARLPEASGILNELAFSENPRVALLAASQLYVYSDAVSIETLARLTRHEDRRRVWTAVGAISGGGAAHPDVAIPALQAVIVSNRDPELVERAKYSLKSIRQHLDKFDK